MEINAIKVIVDDREASSPVFAYLQTYSQLQIITQRLQLGDYQFANKLIFERKTLQDFANSITDGRLFSQTCRLLKSPLRVVLLIEGSAQDLSKIKVKREALQGALITVSIILGIPVLRSMCPAESARLMLYTVNQANSMTNSAIPRHVKRPKGKQRTQLHILQGLPGVGPGRARLLLEKFGSIEAVINATLAELQLIDGVGKKIATRIHWAIKEADATYKVGKI